MKTPEDYDKERRQIIRQLSVLTWSLVAGALFFAILGGALLAWIFTGAGLPFLRTWLIVSLLLLLVPLAVHVAPWPRRKDESEDEA
jgi:membrane protein implicated in regulation of membrane protease activity